MTPASDARMRIAFMVAPLLMRINELTKRIKALEDLIKRESGT